MMLEAGLKRKILALLQAGFAFLEAGSVRSKNLKNILLKASPFLYMVDTSGLHQNLDF